MKYIDAIGLVCIVIGIIVSLCIILPKVEKKPRYIEVSVYADDKMVLNRVIDLNEPDKYDEYFKWFKYRLKYEVHK